MNTAELMKKPLPEITPDIRAALDAGNITLTEFENKNEILVNKELQKEIGYKFFSDGSGLISMTCPMPEITAEMFDWWFWWHPQADERYQVWFPGAHKAISYSKKDSDYFEQSTVPAFRPNEQYPREDVGGTTTTLVIDFVTPEEMGFSRKLMEENNVMTIVCGHVGVRHLFMNSEMSHILINTEDGPVLVSRFWMGKTIKNDFLRKKIITEKMLKGMSEHCCQEYRNLAEILPALYAENA